MGDGRVVTLAGHFDIHVDRPAAELWTPHASAYVVTDRETPSASLFALICDPQMPPRIDVLEALRGKRLEGMLVPAIWGIVEWPLAARRCFAIVYDRPGGGPLAPAAGGAAPVSEDDLVRTVLPPLASSLGQLSAAGATHRAIRADNFHYRDSARRVAVLGDCCSTPPGLAQPLLYETIESALANPWARGDGTAADDLYALGVSMVVLLLGCNPAAELPDDQLLLEKMNRGSYAALVGNERLPSSMVEPVRGLLTDDVRERWTVQDLELWLHGRRLSPKQPALQRRATRAFEFNGESHLTARTLAHALTRKPAAAPQALRSPEFETWLHRSLSDPERSKLVGSALAEGHDVGALGQEEVLTARAAIALDPAAPLRYKGASVAIDAFGSALAGAFRGHLSLAAVAEAVVARLPVFWLSSQSVMRPELVPLHKVFERMRIQLEDRRPGFGPERVAYENCRTLHCLSPLIEAHYVLDPGDVLRAMEASLEQRPAEEPQIDRHLAGFLGARFKLAKVEWLDEIGSADPGLRALGTLKMLASLQSASGPRSARHTAIRLARQLPATLQRFHNRARRKTLLEELPRLAEKGSLTELLALVDGAAERQRDSLGFAAAAREWARIERELGHLRVDGPRRPQRAALLGAQMAAGAAMFLAWAAALGLVVTVS
ncbi:MAG TPA: serine/threonine protein kinase [Stellaceae bacterium]|nr:serine/threonine protein kinase [Stellaceae bacterium]